MTGVRGNNIHQIELSFNKNTVGNKQQLISLFCLHDIIIIFYASRKITN